MRDIFSSDRLMDQLFRILEESDPRVRVYAYRMIGGRPIKPAVYKGEPFPDLLLGILQQEQGGGEFHLLIRRGETMLLSGVVLIFPPVPRKSSGKHP